jgi:hypothetical protein
MDLLKLIILLSLSLAQHLLAAGPALGELDQIYFGVWVDPDLGFQDTPALFNSRLQRNASVFHIAQRMPLLPYNYTTGVGGPAPEYLIENTATDAAVFLTVYPAALSAISDADYTGLGTQLLACQSPPPFHFYADLSTLSLSLASYIYYPSDTHASCYKLSKRIIIFPITHNIPWETD